MDKDNTRSIRPGRARSMQRRSLDSDSEADIGLVRASTLRVRADGSAQEIGMTGRMSWAHLRGRGRRVVEICMLVLGRAGGVSIPAAGFWLMLPLAFALVEPARTTRRTGPHAEAAR